MRKFNLGLLLLLALILGGCSAVPAWAHARCDSAHNYSVTIHRPVPDGSTERRKSSNPSYYTKAVVRIKMCSNGGHIRKLTSWYKLPDGGLCGGNKYATFQGSRADLSVNGNGWSSTIHRRVYTGCDDVDGKGYTSQRMNVFVPKPQTCATQPCLSTVVFKLTTIGRWAQTPDASKSTGWTGIKY